MEVTSQYRLPLAGANLATATVAMALLCARLQAAETAPAPSIMGGAVLCSCEDRHLLWLWMHLPFQSYFCLNYHQWTQNALSTVVVFHTALSVQGLISPCAHRTGQWHLKAQCWHHMGGNTVELDPAHAPNQCPTCSITTARVYGSRDQAVETANIFSIVITPNGPCNFGL
jgi:hypothetical protein